MAIVSHQSVWTPSLWVSLSALGVSIFSTWWINASTGKLKVYEPSSFAITFSYSTELLLCIPLILQATGAKPIVIREIELRFPNEENSLRQHPWRLSRTQLPPKESNDSRLPAAFAIEGRSAQQHFLEFGTYFPGMRLEKRDYKVRIDFRLGHRSCFKCLLFRSHGWDKKLEFILRADRIEHPESYLAYDNAPPHTTKTDSAKRHQWWENWKDDRDLDLMTRG